MAKTSIHQNPDKLTKYFVSLIILPLVPLGVLLIRNWSLEIQIYNLEQKVEQLKEMQTTLQQGKQVVENNKKLIDKIQKDSELNQILITELQESCFSSSSPSEADACRKKLQEQAKLVNESRTVAKEGKVQLEKLQNSLEQYEQYFVENLKTINK